MNPIGFIVDGRRYIGRLDTYHVRHGWSEIVPKDTVLSYDPSLKKNYCVEEYTSTPRDSDISVIIYSTTNTPPPEFMRDKKGDIYDGFEPLCTVSASPPDMRALLVQKHSLITGTYWMLSYKVGIRFGGTELSAFIQWEQSGEIMYGPATIVPMPLEWTSCF